MAIYLSDDGPVFSSEIRWRLESMNTDTRITDDPSTADERGMLYADHVMLEQRLLSVEADLAAYRELAQSALDHVQRLTALLAKATERLTTQQDQLRHLMGLSSIAERQRGGNSPA